MPKGDADLLRADLDDGFISVANLLAEAIPCCPLSASEHSVLWYIMRITYGWVKATRGRRNRQSGKMALVTAKIIARATNQSERTVEKAMQRLQRMNVLVSQPAEIGSAKAYGINPQVSEWGDGTPLWREAITSLLDAQNEQLYAQILVPTFEDKRNKQRENGQVGSTESGGVGAFSPTATGAQGLRQTDVTDKHTDILTGSGGVRAFVGPAGHGKNHVRPDGRGPGHVRFDDPGLDPLTAEFCQRYQSRNPDKMRPDELDEWDRLHRLFRENREDPEVELVFGAFRRLREGTSG